MLQVELSEVSGFGGKVRLCGKYVRIIGQELLGTVLLAPYGELYLEESVLKGREGVVDI
jgi:hypothetical protein